MWRIAILALIFCLAPLTASGTETNSKERHRNPRLFEKDMSEGHPMLLALPGLQAWYMVQPDGSIKLLRGTGHPRHEKLWALVKTVTDRPIHEAYTTFVVFKYREAADKITRYASTAPTSWSPIKHGIALNQIFFDLERGGNEEKVLRDLVPVLIHEYFGHSKVHGFWTNGVLANGCLKLLHGAELFLRKFADMFWPECMTAGEPKRNARDFVSPYAMRDVKEDIAETAVSFVLCPAPKKNANSVVARKLRYFWDDLNAVKYREHVRSAIAARPDLRSVVHEKSNIGRRCA